MFNYYSITILGAVIIGLVWTRRRFIACNISRNDFENLILICTPLTVIGARLFHVITDWSVYRNGQLSIWAIWNGGLGFYGGLVLGMLGAVMYCRWKNISLLTFIDAIYLPLIGTMVLGRWANIFNQELLPYAFFELFFNWLLGIIFGVVEFISAKQSVTGIGLIAFTFVFLDRFFLEFIRLEPRVVFSLLTVNQIISLIMSSICAILWLYISKNQDRKSVV